MSPAGANIPNLPLGDTGVRVSAVGLGCGTFGQEDWGCDENEARRIYERYRSAGGNLIDTANKYGGGQSEAIVGRLVSSERDEVVLGTKYTAMLSDDASGDRNAFGNHRKNLVKSIDASLRRLGTDRLDIIWVHAWDAETSAASLMRALDDQVRAGKVLYLGISNSPAWFVAAANTLAEVRGWTSFSSLQTEYSLAERGAERELLPMCSAMGLTAVAWAPLAWGILTGKYQEAQSGPSRLTAVHPKLTQHVKAVVAVCSDIASEMSVPPEQVALSWIRTTRPDMGLLLGARTEQQIARNLLFLDVALSADHLDSLNAASAIDLGVPQEFLNSADGRSFFRNAVAADGGNEVASDTTF